MPELVNTKTNAIDNVSHDEVDKLLKSGSHDLLEEGTTDVINPHGDLVSIPNKQVYQATSQYGYRFPGSHDVQKFQEQKQYGEGIANELSAFGAGAARAASFGLSDQALTKTGAVDPVTLEKLAEHNPTATTLGEISGIAGSLLAVPGGGLVGGAAKAGNAITKSSGAIANTAAKFLANPETAPMAAKVIQSVGEVGAKTLGSAVEGAAYGLGQSISEDALGDPQALSEKLMANIGYGALFGGAIGGGLKAAEIGIPAGVKTAKDAVTKFKDSLIGSEASGPGLLTKGIAKTSSFLSGAPEESITKSLLERQKTLYGPEDYAKMQSDFIKNTEELHKSVNKAAKTAASEIRPEESAALLEGREVQNAAVEYQKVRIALRDTIKNMEEHPELYPGRFPAKLRLFEDSLNKGIDLEKATAPDLFKALNNLKQDIDKKIPWEKEIGGEAADALNELKSFRGNIKNALENEGAWGEAAARQASFNEAYAEWLTNQKNFRKEFMYKVPAKGGVDYVIRPTKVSTFFNQIADPRGEIKNAALDKYVNSSQKLLDEIEKTYQAVPDKSFDKNAVKSVIDKSLAQKQEAFEQAETIAALRKTQPNIWNQGTSQGGGHEITSLGVLGTAAHVMGVPMAPVLAATEAYHLLANPSKMVQRLAWIERAANHTAESIEKGINTALKISNKVIDPLKGLIFQKLNPTEQRKRYDKVTTQLNELQNNPEMFAEKLDHATKDLYSVAPNVTQSLSTSMAMATGFLASKIPVQPDPAPLSPKYEPSQAEIATFDRYLETVENPLSILGEIQNNTLTSESIETLKTVYPQLYTQISESIFTNISNQMAKKKAVEIPYQTKLTLSYFLGQDLDDSLKQMSIASNQVTLGGIQAQQKAKEEMAAQSVKTTQKGLSNIDLADRLETHTQSVNDRA